MKRRTLVTIVFLLAFALPGCFYIPDANFGGDKSTSELIEQVTPALVQIRVTNPEGALLLALSKKMNVKVPKELESLIRVRAGSGFIVEETGVVVTAAHVIKPGWFMEVTLPDGRKFLVDAVAKDSVEDVGVLLLQGVVSPLPYLEWADGPVKKGDEIFVLGRSPWIDFAYKSGVVSHPARPQLDGSHELQTTMPIVPGESGSAVFNSDGKVIGVASSYYPRVPGVANLVPGPLAEKWVKSAVPVMRKALAKARSN